MATPSASARVANTAELLSSARAEQAALDEKLRAVLGTRGGGGGSPYAGGGPYVGSPHGSPGGAGLDLAGGLSAFSGHAGTGDSYDVLRDHLAELDMTLMELDAEVEGLEGRAASLQRQLDSVAEPKQVDAWKRQFTLAQVSAAQGGRSLKAMDSVNRGQRQECALLKQFVRALEDDARIRDYQLEGLRAETERIDAEQRTWDDGPLRSLRMQVADLEDGYARLVSRLTQSAAAGVVHVKLEQKSRQLPVFACLRATPTGGGTLEAYEEPHHSREMFAMTVQEGRTRLRRSAADHSITIQDLDGGGHGSVRLQCEGWEDYCKWLSGFYLVGLVEDFDEILAVAEAHRGGEHPRLRSPAQRSTRSHPPSPRTGR